LAEINGIDRAIPKGFNNQLRPAIDTESDRLLVSRDYKRAPWQTTSKRDRMGRISYFYSKTRKAWASGTLWDKSSRFLIILVRRPFEVLVGYSRLSRSDRNLNIRDGFADHRQKMYHRKSNPEHLRRIVAAYKASKQAQSSAGLPFQIRGLWEEWISVNYKNLIAALETENTSDLSGLFENLYRERITIGTGGYDNYFRYHTPLGKLYIKYVWSKYRDKLLTLDCNPQNVQFPCVGNPTGVVLNDNVISIETLRHAYHAVEMCELLRDVPKSTVVEIGGGLGGQAYQTTTMSSGQVSKYAVFDIPEVAAISSYFLLSAFPDKRVRLFGEGPASVACSEDYDVAVFPHVAITQLPDASVDLFYNSCSFSEMDGVSSREYLAIIERACRKYFLHDNHDTVFEFRHPDGSVSVNVIGSKLVPDPGLFKRIFKKPRVHGLPEDRSFVHFEYLYERI
jgi:putative sugar O-methyltransferase